MIEEKKTADDLLFEEDKPVFRSMVNQEIIKNDSVRKNKV